MLLSMWQLNVDSEPCISEILVTMKKAIRAVGEFLKPATFFIVKLVCADLYRYRMGQNEVMPNVKVNRGRGSANIF